MLEGGERQSPAPERRFYLTGLSSINRTLPGIPRHAPNLLPSAEGPVSHPPMGPSTNPPSPGESDLVMLRTLTISYSARRVPGRMARPVWHSGVDLCKIRHANFPESSFHALR